MKTFKKHIPNACKDGNELDEINEFNSLEELLEIPYVKKQTDRKTFYRYSLSENHLMAEYESGYNWWVLGFINDISNLDLPKWEAKYK